MSCMPLPPPGQVVLRVIEEVEELSPELQAHPFSPGQGEVLDGRKISVHKAWSGNRRPSAFPSSPGAASRMRTD